MIQIRPIQEDDAYNISEAFAAQGWHKHVILYKGYYVGQEEGERVTLLAVDAESGTFRGYLNVLWESLYAPFADAGIPEITDFNVLMAHQRQGIGSRLMDAAESLAQTRSSVVGLGVGLTADYGAAQQLYVRRGYVPDGRGIVSGDRFLRYGDTVQVDDDLVLYLTKSFGEAKDSTNR